MKKFILILVLVLLTISCNKYIVSNVYEKTYIDDVIARVDVQNQLKVYEMDSIPTSQWMENTIKSDTTRIEQRILRKIVDKNTNYQFIFSMYVYPSSLYYQFVIRYRGKK